MHIFTLWWMHWEQFGVFWVNTLTPLWQHAPICWYNSLLHQKRSPYIWSKTGSDHDINTTMVRRLNEVLMVEFSVRFSRDIKFRYFWLLRYLQRVTACFDMAEFYAGCSSWHNPREIFVCSQGWTRGSFFLSTKCINHDTTKKILINPQNIVQMVFQFVQVTFNKLWTKLFMEVRCFLLSSCQCMCSTVTSLFKKLLSF